MSTLKKIFKVTAIVSCAAAFVAVMWFSNFFGPFGLSLCFAQLGFITTATHVFCVLFSLFTFGFAIFGISKL